MNDNYADFVTNSLTNSTEESWDDIKQSLHSSFANNIPTKQIKKDGMFPG